MKKLEALIPRRMYWSHQAGGTKRCPECGLKLFQEYQNYMMAIEKWIGDETFMTGNDGGHFCPACPVVVLDHMKFLEAAASARRAPGRFRVRLVVAGMVDLKAVPPNKRHLPLGTRDNPTPLVEFLEPLEAEHGGQVPPKARNALCPCGSGRKYKRCCGRKAVEVRS